MLWKCCTQYVSKFGKLSSGHRTGKGQFSFQSQRKAMPNNTQTTAQLHSSHMLVTEKAMAPHSSTLAWKIPWTEETGGLPSMGSHRVGHNWSNLAAAAAAAAACVSTFLYKLNDTLFLKFYSFTCWSGSLFLLSGAVLSQDYSSVQCMGVPLRLLITEHRL